MSSDVLVPPSKRVRREGTTNSPAVFDGNVPSTPQALPAGLAAPPVNTFPSCVECKRRKVKCDRQIPCGACSKRGQAANCQWQWSSGQVDIAQLFASLTSDIKMLKERLLSVEGQLSSLSKDARSNVVVSRKKDASPIVTPTDIPGGIASPSIHAGLSVSPLFDSTQTSNQDNHPDFDVATETAAASLESFANSGPSRTQPSSPLYLPRGTMKSSSTPSQTVATRPEHTSFGLTTVCVPLDSSFGAKDAHLAALLPSNISQPFQNPRLAQLQTILTFLPSAEQGDYLLNLFETKVHWRFQIVQIDLFKAEMVELWGLVTEGRLHEVDPLWIALFFMIMALGITSRPFNQRFQNTSDPFSHLDADQVNGLAKSYHSASLEALRVGDCMGKPQIRMIQTVTLFAVYYQQFLQPSAKPSSAERMLHWLSLAIRSAQILGLHRLGSNPQTMPPDDPAWPPGKNALKRHMALRLWMNIQWADWMSATSSVRGYVIHPETCTSQLVENMNENEISPYDWHIAPRPQQEITSTAFEIFKWHIANALRITFEKLVLQASSFTYDKLLELDAHYQSIARELPFLSLELDDSNLSQTAFQQRHIALIGLHARIARLHRPYLSKGYDASSQYVHSKIECIRSACKVVECHRRVQHVTSEGIFWFAYTHTLSAAMVLVYDLIWSIDHDVPMNELLQKRQYLIDIQAIFADNSHIGDHALRNMVALTHKIVTVLLLECSARQSTRSARRFSGSTDSDASLDPFPALISRVASAVQAQGSGTTGLELLDTSTGASTVDMAGHFADVGESAHALGPTGTFGEAVSYSDSRQLFAQWNMLDLFVEPSEISNNNLVNLTPFLTEHDQTSNAHTNGLTEDEPSHLLRQLMGFDPL